MVDNLERETVNKPKRVPVGGIRDIMTVYNKDPDFMYYWVKDTNENGSRLNRFMRGGYEFATYDKRSAYVIGDEAVYKSKQHGSIIRLPTGHGEYSYLMRLPMEFHLEDKAAKEAKIAEMEGQMLNQAPSDGKTPTEDGVYGTVKLDRD